MDDLGAATFTMNVNELIEEAVPDTEGKTQAEIDAMPPYVRSFKCGKRIEQGDPTCSDSKYTNLSDVPKEDFWCNDWGHASWHPGWYVRLYCCDDFLVF